MAWPHFRRRYYFYLKIPKTIYNLNGEIELEMFTYHSAELICTVKNEM